jgi:hypothetical protein
LSDDEFSGHVLIVALDTPTTIRAVTLPPGRSAAVSAAAGIAVAFLMAGCSPALPLNPGPTEVVAALPTAPAGTPTPSLPSSPSPTPRSQPASSPASSPDNVRPDPSTQPSLGPEPSSAPPANPGIVPGKVNRSSLDVSATYGVNAAISVRTGALDVTTHIEARNQSGSGIDRLELNTIAARLGGIVITAASVDDRPVKVRVTDQTLVVPLGGVLPDGASTSVRIAYRATLRLGLGGSDWMFTRAGGTLALYRWIPWISKAVPFNRPNQGEPFVTTTSPKVEVELLTDRPMVLAGPAATIDQFAAGQGSAWSFTVENVRDVSLVLASDFNVTRGDANGIPIRAFTRPGGLSGDQLVAEAADAVTTDAGLLGTAYPGKVLAVVETRGGYGLESPGLVWIPVSANSLNRTYLVYKTAANQWFYGLVGSDQQAEPFADEGPADLLARTALGSLRSSHCGRDVLDRSITYYSLGCYYEVIQVQGGSVLDAVRKQVGSKSFWKALGTYLQTNRDGLSGTRQLLEAIRAGSDVNLLPTLKARFPSLY